TRTTTRVKVRQVVKTVVRYRTVTQVKHVTRVRTVVHHKLVYQTKVRYVTRVRYQTKVVTRDRMVTRVVTQYHYVQHPKTGRFAAPIAVRSSSIIPSVIPAAGARMSIARLGLSWLPVWSRDYIADVNGNLLYDIVPATGVTRFAPSAGFGR